MREGTLVSEKPVELKLPEGMLDANRLEVIDSGDLVRFDGGVVMMLNAEKPRNAGSDRTAQQ